MFPFYFGNRPSAAEPVADDEPEVDLDPDGVSAWRLRQLIAAGWPFPYADLLALDREVDLHQACDLLTDGCSLEQAWAILA